MSANNYIKKISSFASRNNIFIYSIILLIAFALRGILFGKPFLSVDEQFYLLTGGRILAGDLPFVDVWDRKPIGIFLIYAFFHLFGAGRFWAYQIGATLSAATTAILILKSARLIAPLSSAFISALLYLGWINVFQGYGGQTPIFYNALIAYAMYLVIKNIPFSNENSVKSTAIKTMILFGIALQIKYTVVFEGCFLGLYLVYNLYRKNSSVKKTSLNALLWAIIALIPTLAVLIFYTLLGHAHDWWFANVESIFLRKKTHYNSLYEMFYIISALLILPTIIYIIKNKPKDKRVIFVFLWAMTAWLGVFIFGDYFKHYFIPLLIPFPILFSNLINYKYNKLYIYILLVIGMVVGEKTIIHIYKRQNTKLLADINHLVSKDPGCIFSYDAAPTLQDIQPYCHLSPYLFPGHLSSIREKRAIGVDQKKEIKRVLSQHPTYIIVRPFMDTTQSNDTNYDIDNFLYSTISHDYNMIYSMRETKKSHLYTKLYKIKQKDK